MFNQLYVDSCEEYKRVYGNGYFGKFLLAWMVFCVILIIIVTVSILINYRVKDINLYFFTLNQYFLFGVYLISLAIACFDRRFFRMKK